MKMLHLIMATILVVNTSCLKPGPAPKIPGVDGPTLNVLNGKIVLTVGLEKLDLPGGITLPIPKLDNSTVAISPRLEGGTLLQVSFDPSDVNSDEFKVVPAQTLPDGRPFPFTIDGTLPSLAINVPRFHDTTFYVSNKVFGFFIPFNIPKELPLSIHYRLRVNDKNLGIVSLINPDAQGDNGGIILLLTMKEIQENPEIKNLLKLSKSRKYRKVLF